MGKQTTFSGLRSDLRRLQRRIQNRAMRQVLNAGGKVLLAEMRRRAPNAVISRSLRIRFHSQSGVIQAADVGPKAKTAAWASWWEHGTRPHPIPKAGHPLRSKHGMFASKSGPFFGKRVNHPGRKARPFIRPSLEATEAAVIEAMADMLGREISAEIP